MDVTVLPESFTRALDQVAAVISKRGSSVPIIQNVLLETKDAELWLTATDLEMTIRVPIGAKVDHPGAITLPCKQLLEIIALRPVHDNIRLRLDEDTATVTILSREFEKRGRITDNVKGIMAREFPTLPSIENNTTVAMQTTLLRQALEQTIFVLGHNDSRPALSGIYFQIEPDNIRLTASDGYRISERKFPVESLYTFDFILPAMTCKRLLAMLDDEKETVFSVDSHEQQAKISIGRIEIFSQVIGSKFPDYHPLMQHYIRTNVTVYTNDLLRACKRAELFARDFDSQRITLDVRVPLGPNEPGQILVNGKSYERGDAETTLDAAIEGDSMTIYCNVYNLMDVLTACAGTERIELQFDHPNTPIFLHPEDESVDYVAIIAPMNVITKEPTP